MENWSISDLVDEEDDWSISDIVEANEKRYVRERDSFMKRKLPLANLSVAESEALRVIVCGLYPEGEIESAQDIERQMGCKNKNILTDGVTTEKADTGQSSGEGSTEETRAKTGPDE